MAGQCFKGTLTAVFCCPLENGAPGGELPTQPEDCAEGEPPAASAVAALPHLQQGGV